MLTFVASCIQWVLSAEIVLGSDDTASKFMNMNGYSTSWKNMTEPLLDVKDEKDVELRSRAGFDSKASSNIRVKVKMRKQEAARLLSKCKEGGFLEFRDVARELVELPLNQINIVSSSTDSNAVLYSIAEEY